MAHQNALFQFASETTIVRETIGKMFKVEHSDPSSYRLSVATPFDKQQSIEGMYNVEAAVMLPLLDTVYAEIVSAANRETRANATIPVADRGRSLSGYDDQYDGAEDPEITDDDLENDLDNAIARAGVVLGYMTHIANIKDGGAEWLKGFEVSKWIAKDPKDEAATLKCQLPGADLSNFIHEGRVMRVKERVKNRIITLDTWIEQQLAREGTSPEWKNKLAMCRVQQLHVEATDVSTAKDYIGDIVNDSAFNRDTTRLEEAIARVSNRKYMALTNALNNGIRNEIIKTFKAAYPTLCYSSMLVTDLNELNESPEWQDHQLQQEVNAAKREAEQELRNAIRAQNLFDVEKQAKQIAAIRAQAAGILAMIKKEKDAIAKSEKKAKTATKATKAATKATTKAKASSKKATTSKPRSRTTGIAGTSIAFAGSK